MAIILTMSALTWVWWEKDVEATTEELNINPWHLTFAKICPVMIFSLFAIFNVWI